jgi:hypothetical protein
VGVHRDAVRFLADDETDLGVNLQVREPIRYMDAGAFQLARPIDVVGFIEACGELNQTATCLPRPAASMSASRIGESARCGTSSA